MRLVPWKYHDGTIQIIDIHWRSDGSNLNQFRSLTRCFQMFPRPSGNHFHLPHLSQQYRRALQGTFWRRYLSWRHGQWMTMRTLLGSIHMAVGQNLVPLVNIKIAGKWMFIPLKMVLIGIDPYPYLQTYMCHFPISHARMSYTEGTKKLHGRFVVSNTAKPCGPVWWIFWSWQACPGGTAPPLPNANWKNPTCSITIDRSFDHFWSCFSCFSAFFSEPKNHEILQLLDSHVCDVKTWSPQVPARNLDPTLPARAGTGIMVAGLESDHKNLDLNGFDMICMDFFNISENFEQANQLCVGFCASCDFHGIKGDQLVQSTKQIEKSKHLQPVQSDCRTTAADSPNSAMFSTWHVPYVSILIGHSHVRTSQGSRLGHLFTWEPLKLRSFGNLTRNSEENGEFWWSDAKWLCCELFATVNGS